MWRKGNPRALFMGIKIYAATMENIVDILQKLKNGAAL